MHAPSLPLHGRRGIGGSAPAQRRPVSLSSVACRAEHSSKSLQLHHITASERDPLVSYEGLPLHGKRVIVTAPRQYAEKLCSKLITAGARPLWLPGVAISALLPEHHTEEVAELDAALRKLMKPGHGYTHIAFTSKNGIYAVLQRLAHLTGGSLDDACQVLHDSKASLCALGADGAVLTKAGLAVHVSPREASTQGLVKELESLGEARGARILCPVPLVTGGLTEPPVVPRFLASLESVGARPVRLSAYETSLGSTPEECQAEALMLDQGHVAAIAFSSTAEAQGLAHVLGVQRIRHAVEKHGVLLAAHGPYTAQGASQVLGLPIPCVSNAFGTFDGLVHAMESHFASKGPCTSHSNSGHGQGHSQGGLLDQSHTANGASPRQAADSAGGDRKSLVTA